MIETPKRGPKKGEPRNTGRPCSLAEFTRLWHDMCLSMADLATDLQLSERTVSQRAKLFGLPLRTSLRGKARDHFDAEFPAFWVFGVCAHDIARHYGVETCAVHMRAHRMGLSAKGRGVSRHAPGRTIADFREVQMAAAMARAAAETQVAWREAGMVDAPAGQWRRAA